MIRNPILATAYGTLSGSANSNIYDDFTTATSWSAGNNYGWIEFDLGDSYNLTTVAFTPQLTYGNLVPQMMSTTSPSGVVSVSSYHSSRGSYQYGAFQYNNGGLGWVTAAGSSLPQWCQYQFPSPVLVTAYAITPWTWDTFPTRAPKNWQLQASNDGIAWDVLDIQTNYTNWSFKAPQLFTFNNSTSYSYYRLYITVNNGDTLTAIQQLQLLTSVPSGTKNIKVFAGTTPGTMDQVYSGSVNLVSNQDLNVSVAKFARFVRLQSTPQDTVALFHFNGSNGSQSFVEEIGRVVSITGNISHSTAQSKFGGSSTYFDGTSGNKLTLPASDDFALGSFGVGGNALNWTIEGWIYPTAFKSPYSTILSYLAAGGNAQLYINPSGQLVFTTTPSGTNTWTGQTIPLNQWSHIALVTSIQYPFATIAYINGQQANVLTPAQVSVSGFNTNVLSVSANGLLLTISPGTTAWSSYQNLPSYLLGLLGTTVINSGAGTTVTSSVPMRIYLLRDPVWGAVDLTGYQLIEMGKPYLSGNMSVYAKDVAAGTYTINSSSAMYLFAPFQTYWGWPVPTAPAGISLGWDGTAGREFTGYMDEFRISKNAVYNSNFNPPTAPFALDANIVDNTWLNFSNVVINDKSVISSQQQQKLSYRKSTKKFVAQTVFTLSYKLKATKQFTVQLVVATVSKLKASKLFKVQTVYGPIQEIIEVKKQLWPRYIDRKPRTTSLNAQQVDTTAASGAFGQSQFGNDSFGG
jgi:hypothetical protein